MHKTWCLLHTMSAELKRHVSGSDVTLALNVGARAFLEQSYQQYVRSELQQHRNQVHCLLCCQCCRELAGLSSMSNVYAHYREVTVHVLAFYVNHCNCRTVLILVCRHSS